MAHRRRRALVPIALFTVVASALVSGAAPPAAAVSQDIVVSQVYGGGGNSGAPFANDFIEIYNRGGATVDLTDWSVQYASATGTGNFADNSPVALSGNLPPGRHYLVQLAGGGASGSPLPTPDATGTIAMAATSGKVVAVRGTFGLSCNGGSDPCDPSERARIVDLVGYGTANMFEGDGPAPALTNTSAALRANDGETDTDNNAADFTAGEPNPRNCGEDCTTSPPDPSSCDDPATHQIAQVQGGGDSTPIPNTIVRVEGIVTGDFQDPAELGGFFFQDDTPDADPMTSDGLFAFSPTAVEVGDRVLVTGRAAELNALTVLSPVSNLDVCGMGTIAPTPYDLPRAEGSAFEPFESVLVTFPETLTATDHFQLGRFGEIFVSSEGRLFEPTDLVEPGAAANAIFAENQRRSLLIDDGSNVQNPDTVPFLTANVVRVGDTATGITGVLGFGFGQYRLQPTEPITFTRANPRPAVPDPVGGDIKVASFNVMNYFTTVDHPNARGADNEEEFVRQQTKLVEAIRALDSDVIGLMEIENNGGVAVASLVDALNAATAPGTYGFLTEPVLNDPNEFGGTFGTDVIQVALIYRPASVTPVGPAHSSSDEIFDRPPLIQTFRRGESEPFTVAVNHFTSKNCSGFATGLDQDQGDGQGCFNARRVGQATALVGTLDTLDVPSPLIIGDLNTYALEDPLDTLETAAYTELSESFISDDDRYSFVLGGFSGALDHALAGTELLDNVAGATIWHINADEPVILDYNTELNPAGLYQPDAHRSSDHDPLIVGLDLVEVDTTAPVVEITSSPSSPTTDNTPMIEFTVDDDDASIMCRVDDGEAQTCSSPFTTDALDDGEHSITVTATDVAGNAGSDSVTFVVDSTAPDTTITSGPSGTTTSASATFAFLSSEDDSSFECRLDGGAWADCTSPHTVTVAPSTHTFDVRAVDALGNADPTPASRTWAYQKCMLVRVRFSLFGISITLCL